MGLRSDIDEVWGEIWRVNQLLERNGFILLKEKGSIRYYSKPGHDKLVRVDYHGSKEVPTGTCHAVLKAAGIGGKKRS
jgi:predicted RNA binding protein YcfA (HicA-like mRNA interferase family)